MKKRRLCQICLILLCAIILRFLTVEEKPSICEQNMREGALVLVQGKVYEKKITEDRNVVFLENLKIFHDQDYVAARERLPVYLTKEEACSIPEIGDEILVEGVVKTVQEPTNPGNFNQRFYYQKQNMFCMLQRATILQRRAEGTSIRERLWKIRKKLAERIVSYMGERYGGILCTMLFCEESYERDEVKEVYQKSGLGHLLAVSSLHIMFWGMGLYKILKKLHIHKYAAVVSSILGLGGYMVFIGGGISAMRAFSMFVIRMVGILLGREYDPLTALSISAMIQLILQPRYLFDAGFLLSYGAVLGIFSIGEVWKKGMDEQACGVERGSWKRRLGEKLRIPFAVQVMIFPIMLYFYYEICIYSFVWNLIAVPFASLVMSLGAAGMFVPIILKMAGMILWFWEWGSRWILQLPFSRWVTGQPRVWQIFLYYIGMCMFLLWMKKEEQKRRKMWCVLLGGVAVGILLLTLPQKCDRSLEVAMVDVGQGDGIFVKSPSGKTAFVDGGSSSIHEVGRYKIEPFLKYKGVGYLDYVFLSHGDEDHISGIKELLERQLFGVKIGALVLPPQRLWDENLTEIAKQSEEKGISVYTMEQGEQLQLGELAFLCLWASPEVTESGNAASMVLSMSCGEFDLLFTGDLELDAEEKVSQYMEVLQERGSLPNSYEVLKVGHHGSKNATGKELLEVCKPKIALISAGEENSYGHPNEETIKRLEEYACEIYCTIECGMIDLRYTKDRIVVRKFKRP